MTASGEPAAVPRVWRERLTPQTVGLPTGTARRTSGLRREEPAVLAEVSADYIVRLEQGRATAPSAQVCASPARALQLSDAERDHLFRLAGHATGGGRVNRIVPASLRRLVERTGDRPMAVFDAVWDPLLWNRMWAALTGDLSELREDQRNVLWLHFVQASERRIHDPEGRDAFGVSMAADLRRSMGRYPDDPALRKLVERLNESSVRFRELWQRHEIAEHDAGPKQLTHPEAGLLELDCDILSTQRDDLRIVMYSAAPGSESDSKLALLTAIGTQRMRVGP
ncbi:helix-turn-helix transcriptional regulator [Streptomyces sp. NPDC058739]|uniref:helix-turn-helix transcriptional regulator n=1 Tax=Streptomyces sp. NPDC058739 TaxID=3346618 RepID=UPI0036B0091C